MTDELKEILELYEDEELVIAEQGDWQQVYKYQHKYTICEYNDRFFEVFEQRSGSPFTDWDYLNPFIREVVRKEKVVTQVYWEAV